MSEPEPKPWYDEDVDERIASLKAEMRWDVTRQGHPYPREGGHLVVLHASALADLLATLEKYREEATNRCKQCEGYHPNGSCVDP